MVAGDPIQQKPTVLRAELNISPSMAGKLELEGKYAKKLGLCQCVMPAHSNDRIKFGGCDRLKAEDILAPLETASTA